MELTPPSTPKSHHLLFVYHLLDLLFKADSAGRFNPIQFKGTLPKAIAQNDPESVISFYICQKG